MEKFKFYEETKHKLKIFQIGFNKCGTRSLCRFFRKNGVKSVHYDGGRIASSMFRHYRNNEPLVDIRYRDKVFFSDMESIVTPPKPLYVGTKLFTTLYNQYPNSYFILNTRDKENWIKSRVNHGNKPNEVNYLGVLCDKLDKTPEEIIDIWDKEWDNHHKNIIHFFKDKPGRLVIYNIEKDPINKIVNFFEPILNLNQKYYEHIGKS